MQFNQHANRDRSNSQADSASSILVTRSIVKRLITGVIVINLARHQILLTAGPTACPMAYQCRAARRQRSRS
jgi:hypothetical protein